MASQLWARFPGGVVVETWPPDPTAAHPEGVATPVDAFGEAFGSQFVPCAASVQQGWTTPDGGKTFAAPVEPAGPPLASVQAALCSDVDRQAQAQRDLYVTPGGAQSATYLIKQSQAQSALAAQAGNTSANMTAAQLAAAYPYLANEVGITVDPTSKAPAVDVYGVARSVMAVLQAWQPINLAIEAMRLKTKAAIAAAATATVAQAAHDAVAWPAPATS